MTSKVDMARRLVRALLAGKEAPSQSDIAAAVSQAVMVSAHQPDADGPLDEEALRREFESNYQVFFRANGQMLEDPHDHIPWLPVHRATIRWDFWGRYEHFLSEVEEIPPQVIARLHTATDDVLSRLENPAREGTWDRRGLVVGNVQSGKTSNYSGLICKALDAGYKLVIILAGMHKSLRSQTQMRIDQGIIGFDTAKSPFYKENNAWIGVGELAGWPRLRVNSLTNSKNNGDFNKTVSGHSTTALGGDPYILVVKKNRSILENLIEWATHTNGVPTEGGKKIIRNVPLLLIDDEADNASVNTARVPDDERPEDYEPSAINAKIRELLLAFEKRAYVGYTATPFANIFVPSDIVHERLEDDIFPQSFIYSLAEPSNYVGPARVFGLDGDPDVKIDPQPGLPIVETIEDHKLHFPPKYGKEHDPRGLPDSLQEALRIFILASAARRARGQTRKVNSMLIHVARLVSVQRRVYEHVQEEFTALQRRIRYDQHETRNSVWSELESLWFGKMEPCSVAMRNEGYSPVPWSEVSREIREAVERIQLRLINGEAADVLDYHEHPDGINVIAIGGDKLSRGLTLPGLTVSYYLRATRMYDTLMQMGRWFGYRDGYLDLCRLYTTKELRDWYRHIALADIELRREFQTMVDCGMTPKEYGLRVRSHPGGLLITALNKSRYTKPIRLSFAGRLVQSKFLRTDARKENSAATKEFLSGLPKSTYRTLDERHRLWSAIPATSICAFLRSLKVPAQDVDADGERLAKFIERQQSTGGLTDWSVLLAGGGPESVEKKYSIFFDGLLPVIRTPFEKGKDTEKLPAVVGMLNANILSPADQNVDFRGIPFSQAHFDEISTREVFVRGGQGENGEPGQDVEILNHNIGQDLITVATRISVVRFERKEIRGKEKPTTPNGGVVRDMRQRHRGLLIIYPTMAGHSSEDGSTDPMIGTAISFPRDDAAAPLEYLVNQVYEQLQLSDPEDPDNVG